MLPGPASPSPARSLLLNALVAFAAAAWAITEVGFSRGVISVASLALAGLLCGASWVMDATAVRWGSDRGGRAQMATAADAVLLPAAVLLPPALFLAVAAGTAVGLFRVSGGPAVLVGNVTVRVAAVSCAAAVFTLLAPEWPLGATEPIGVAALAAAGVALVLTESVLVVSLVRGWDGLSAREAPLLEWPPLAAAIPEVLLGAVFCLLYPSAATVLVLGLIAWLGLTVRGYAQSRAADRDPKTGLLSWPGFEQLAGDELERAHREGRPLQLLLMDLDGLKAINTAHGHLVGDRCIRATAEAVAAAARVVDLAARFGGDEFALLLPDTSEAEGLLTAEVLRLMMLEARVTDVTVPLSLSIGVAALEPHDDVRSLVASADAALRLAKAHDGNRVVTTTAVRA
jgi:diguanylate cyclase (GGDEF)-like protein